jgi:parallel beta-helix repeat protein
MFSVLRNWLTRASVLCSNGRPPRGRRRPRWVPQLEQFEDRWLLAACVVTSAADSGAHTLRDLIDMANDGRCDNDIITFGIGAGPQTIQVGLTTHLPLPNINRPMTIDGFSQPGYDDHPVILLDGTAAGGGIGNSGLTINSSGVTVQGLAIDNFSAGITLAGSDNKILWNYIGTDLTGTQAVGNRDFGVFIDSGDGNTLVNNVISGNGGTGVSIGSQSGTELLVNKIGTDRNG